MTRRRLAVPVAALALLAEAFAWVPAARADVPVVVDDQLVVQKDSLGNNLLVLANDTVAGAAEITAVTTPDHGVAAIVGSGRRIGYSPDAGYAGTDSFQYTVTDPVDGDATATVTIKVNDAPVAADDPAVPGCNPAPGSFGDSFPIPEDWGPFALTSGPCAPGSNDSDPDGTIASWQVDTPPAHGTLDWDPDVPGAVTYTPDADYSTPDGDWPSDSFTYHVIDDNGASSNVATYRLWIAPVNDAPSFTPGADSVETTTGVAYDAPWATDIAPGPANESDQTVQFEVTHVDEHGASGLFSVEPSIDATGRLSFTSAARGLATVTVVATDDGGLVDYDLPEVHPADTSAPVSFDIVIGNAAPTADDDMLTVNEDAAPTAVPVLGNDTDAEDDALSISGKTNGAKGTVTITGGGTGLTYQPNPNANGTDTFTYTVDDGHGGTDTASVAVTITAVNDNPNAVNDPGPFTVYLKAPATAIPVLQNDTWLPDAAETLAITAVTQGGHGSVAITGGGTGLAYTATGSALGLDLFTYTISDGHGGTDTATVQVNVLTDTTAPSATFTAISRSAIRGHPSTARVTIRWSLSDTGSGIAGELLQMRTGDGPFVTVALPSVSSRSVSIVVSRSRTVTFRLRATDRAGNVGPFATRAVAT